MATPTLFQKKYHIYQYPKKYIFLFLDVNGDKASSPKVPNQ